jgi:predicted MFS family arabinose efflux permease
MRRTIGAHPWLVLGLLTAFWGLVGLNRLGISYLFPIIVPEFHMAYWQASLLISGTSATWAVTSWLSGWLADRYGRRRVMLPGAALACVSTAAMGGAWGFGSMLVVREFVGVGDGVGWSTGQAVLAGEFPPKRRALVQSIFTSGYTLFGSVLGALIVTHLAESLGWRPVFPILSLVFLFVVLGLYLFMREPPRATDARPDTGRGDAADTPAPAKPSWLDGVRILRNRTVLLLMIVQAGALGWLQVAVGYNALFLTRVRGMELTTAGDILALFGVAGLIGTLTLPFCSDYLGRKPTMLVSGLLSGGCLIAYALGGGLGTAACTALLAGSGFFQGVLIPLAAATCVVENVPARLQATAMGAVNFAGVVVGTFVMPMVAGFLADGLGLTAPILLAGGCAVVAGLAVAGISESAPRVLARRAATVAVPSSST